MKIGRPLLDLLPPEFTLAELDVEMRPESTVTDGRVARGQRTRRNVAEALMELLREGDQEPTARAVAQRAGVSLRLVFHHFTEMDDLYHYVAALQLRRQWSDMPRISSKLALATRARAHGRAPGGALRRGLTDPPRPRAPDAVVQGGDGHDRRRRRAVAREPEGDVRAGTGGARHELQPRGPRGDGRGFVLGGVGTAPHRSRCCRRVARNGS